MSDKPKGFDEATPFKRTFIKPSILKSFLPTWPYLRKPEGGVIQSSDKPKWERSAMPTPNPREDYQALIARLSEQYRNNLRELEAEIVLSAIELYGVDIRGLHQQIHRDRTVYLVNGKPLVEVHRPRDKNPDRFKPNTWMDNADKPMEMVVPYRLLYTPETKS